MTLLPPPEQFFTPTDKDWNESQQRILEFILREKLGTETILETLANVEYRTATPSDSSK